MLTAVILVGPFPQGNMCNGNNEFTVLLASYISAIWLEISITKFNFDV